MDDYEKKNGHLNSCSDRPSSPVPALLSDSGNIIDTEDDLFKGLSALLNSTSSVTDGSKMAISMEDYLLADSVEVSGTETDVAPLLKDLTSESGTDVTTSEVQDLRSSEETGDDKNVNVASLLSEVPTNAADEIGENLEQASDEEKKNSLDAMLVPNVDAENRKKDLEEEKNDIDEKLVANPAAEDGKNAESVDKIQSENSAAEDGKNAESVDKIQSENSAVQDTNKYLENKRKHYDDFVKPAPVSTKKKINKKSNGSRQHCSPTIVPAGKLHRKIQESEDTDSGSDGDASDSSEYVPSEDSDGENGGNSSDEENTESANATQTAVNSSCDSSEYSLQTSFNVPGNSACDERDQMAELSRAKGGQKKNFCFYCKTEQSKIARHLENKHADKEEVKKFLSLPKKNIERGQIIANIRKKGNFLHNVNRDYNNGKLIPVRRPRQSEKRPGQHFVPCPRCRGFYSKNNIRHHFRVCSNKKDNSRRVLTEARQTLGRIHECASVVLRQQVFPVLRDDDTTRLIRYDKLVILFANKLCKRLRLPHQHNEIRAELRRLGRFLEAIRKIEPNITDMASVFNPAYYNAAVDAVNVISELDEKSQLYNAPSVASGMGSTLKKLGHLMEAECIKNHDVEKKRNAKNFLKLLLDDYGTSVNRGVAETMAKKRRSKRVILPKNDDIRKLNDFLDKAIDKASSCLKKTFNPDAWKDLAEATLTKLLVFNRRRVGELERLPIEEFGNRETIQDDDDFYKELSKEDKISAKKYVRINLRGKLGRTVPVLITTETVDNLNLLLNHRKAAGVHSTNPFVFGTAGPKEQLARHLKACILMRKFSSACGADNPASLRGTILRKHMATRCADMELTDNQISSVANFMGHHENIHRNIYRQSVVKADIVEMSKLLENAQGSNNALGSSEHNASGINSTDEGLSVTDSNQCELSTCDSNDASGMTQGSLAETTPVRTKRPRSDSDQSPLESPERAVPAKPTKKNNKKARKTSTPSRESPPKAPVETSSLKTKNANRPRRHAVSSPSLTPVILTSTPYRTTRGTKGARAAARSSPDSTPENTPPVLKKKKGKTTSYKKADTSQSSSDTSMTNTKAKCGTKPKSTTRSPTEKSAKPKTKRIRWTKTEIDQALECFSTYLDADKLPSLATIEKIKQERQYLQRRPTDVIKTWLCNQLQILRKGKKPQYVSTPISKSVLSHAKFIFEEHIADERTPTRKECEDVRKNDKKMRHLSAADIRNLVKSLIDT